MELLIKEIGDESIRENFKRLQNYFSLNYQLEGFTHVDIALLKAVASHKVYHGLGYIPLDVIKTHEAGMGELEFNYEKFDRDFIDVTTTGPCHVRAFIGTFRQSKPPGATQ